MIIHIYYFPKKDHRNEEAVSVARSVMFMQDELFPGWGCAASALGTLSATSCGLSFLFLCVTALKGKLAMLLGWQDDLS